MGFELQLGLGAWRYKPATVLSDYAVANPTCGLAVASIIAP
jgi:hypothetical protein